MTTNLDKLYNNRKYSDCDLVLSSETIHANKSVLAIHSKFFDKYFFQDKLGSSYRFTPQKNENNNIEISEENFATMIKFIYTGEVTVNDANVLSIRECAKHFAVVSLEEKCEEFFAQTLTLDNVFGFLDKAENSGMPKLMASCLTFVCKNAKKVFAENQHFKFGKRTFIELLKRDDLRMREIEVFKSVVRYCDNKSGNDKAASMALAKEFSPYIRFTVIPMKDLITEVFPLNILSVDERLKVLEQQVLNDKSKFMRKATADVTFEIKRNIDYQELLDAGWKAIYNFPFSHSTTFDELANLKDKYGDDAAICCLGKKANSNEVVLAAFGPYKQVLTPSDSKSVAKQHGEVFWYYVKGESFGFAEASNISLGSADTVSGEKRMSWHLSGGGGYRIGDNTNLNGSSDFEKILMVYEC